MSTEPTGEVPANTGSETRESSKADETPQRGGSTRRTVLKALTTFGAGGFFLGAPAYVTGVKGGFDQGENLAKEGLVKMLRERKAPPSGITEYDISQSGGFVQLTPESAATTPPQKRFPKLVTEYDAPIITTLALTPEELRRELSYTDPDQKPKKADILVCDVPEVGEESYVYQIALPEGSSEGALFVDLDPLATCYVQGKSGQELSYSLSRVERVENAENTHVLKINAGEPFEVGSSAFLVVNTKSPPEKPLVV